MKDAELKSYASLLKRPGGSGAGVLRVAFLTAAETWSGVEVHTLHLANSLKERGHDVFIVELGRRGYVDTPLPVPCPVVHLSLGPGQPEETPIGALSFGDWRRVLGSLQADVAISVKGTFKFCSVAMEAAARLCFRRFLVIEHLHAPLGNRPQANPFKLHFGFWWYQQKLSGYLHSVFPNRVICVSHAVAATLRGDYGYSPAKLFVAHSGVDANVFIPDSSVHRQARNAWGIPDAAFVFGTVGRLSPMKNHGQLIEAFAKLVAESGRSDIYLVIVGEGPLHSSLEALARSRGVRDRVILAGFSSEPQKICPGFDVFCFPSTSGESLGIALLEAMSCGCPAIAAATGGVPEIVNDERVGWLIPSGDENALLAAMRLVIGLDKDTLQQLGANARDRVRVSFDSAARFGALAEVIEEDFLQKK